MNRYTTHTSEQFSDPARSGRFEQEEKQEKRSPGLLKKVGYATLAVAAAGGTIVGMKALMEIPTDSDMSHTPEDTSITQISLVEGAKVRANPGINEVPDDPDSNVIGSVENKSDAADDAITLVTPDGVRVRKNIVDGQKDVFYGFDLDELKKAGIDITGKDNDNIGWVEQSQITDIVQNDEVDPE